MTTEANAIRPTESGVVHYRIDPHQSRIAVQAFAEGLLSAFGHDPIFEVRDYAGEGQFTPDTFAEALAKLTIKAESLGVVGDVKEKDRAEIERTTREEVLEAAKYPDISFTSTRISLVRQAENRYRATIVGDLTLHGATQNNLWIPGEVTISEGKLHLKGEFTLKPKDYGMKLISVAGGTLKVKNEVKCSFEITAVKDG